ncbi:MAG: hypothetical protein PUF41_01335 [Prevotella copri]|nr:hypothetical protein [Segatella copri]
MPTPTASSSRSGNRRHSRRLKANAPLMPRDTGGSSSTHGSTGRQGASSSTSDASTRGWRLGADSPPGPTDRASTGSPRPTTTDRATS